MSAPSAPRNGQLLPEHVLSVVAELLQSSSTAVDVVGIAALDGRIKIAVRSTDPHHSAVSTCVGLGGRRAAEFNVRLAARVEFVEFDPNPARYVAEALNVEVMSVRLESAPAKAVVVVNSKVYPFAGGPNGTHAQLTSRLTNRFVTICTPECSPAGHHHPVGVSAGEAWRRRPDRARRLPSCSEAGGSVALPPHVRAARSSRQRRTRW